MEEEFEFGFTEDPKFSVERYEEMIRNHDQYFFDAQAFENIIDYYIEKNDPPKALQVAEYACNQHPFAAVFLVKQAQLLVIANRTAEAFAALESRERNLLRYALGDGLSVDAIGTLYRVHRATAARWGRPGRPHRAW